MERSVDSYSGTKEEVVREVEALGLLGSLGLRGVDFIKSRGDRGPHSLCYPGDSVVAEVKLVLLCVAIHMGQVVIEVSRQQ